MLFRVLGHPVRLSILLELAAGPKCVTDIQELVRVQQANVSQHLSALRMSGSSISMKTESCGAITLQGRACAVILRLIEGDFPVVSQSRQCVRRVLPGEVRWSSGWYSLSVGDSRCR